MHYCFFGDEAIKTIETTCKTLLLRNQNPTSWFGVGRYFSLYRGCEHGCIYCDSRSDCYGADGFDELIEVKANAVDKLREELSALRSRCTIGMGAMCDPYMPVEMELGLTGRALEVIREFNSPLFLMTKSDLVLRDIDLISSINKHIYASVCFTVTTADDGLALKLEPGASPPSRRFAAMRRLVDRGIPCGLSVMPVLPFIEDNEENMESIVENAAQAGASYAVPAFGVTLRGRQRAWYYKKLDSLFPGMSARYEQTFGNAYGCNCPNAEVLKLVFDRECRKHGIACRMEDVKSWVGQGRRLSR